MVSTSQFFVLLGWFVGYLLGFSPKESSQPIKYLNSQTINHPIAKVETRLIPSEEGESDDTLFQHLSADDMPVFYTQNIQTSVCFDNKCRLLAITLYWNPSGRYLGFVLPENEYLSKKDHDPFTEKEYEKLNGLLADPNLPLGTIAYNELVLASQPSLQGLDGVSGATSKDMLSYVIEGAAFTTHKIYSILYGPSQAAVENWTLENLSAEFIHEVISSTTIQDVYWGLEVLKGKLGLYPELAPEILEMVSSEDYSTSEKALSVFLPKDLNHFGIQSKLVQIFPKVDVGRKKSILDLFKGEENRLDPPTLDFFNSEISDMEIPLIVQVIDIYKSKGIRDPKSKEAIGNLASSGNSYLSEKAKAYLIWAN